MNVRFQVSKSVEVIWQKSLLHEGKVYHIYQDKVTMENYKYDRYSVLDRKHNLVADECINMRDARRAIEMDAIFMKAVQQIQGGSKVCYY